MSPSPPSVYYLAFQAIALGMTWGLLLTGYRTMGRVFFRVSLAVVLLMLGIGWSGLPASGPVAPVRIWHGIWLLAALAWTGLTAVPDERVAARSYPLVAVAAAGWLGTVLVWLRATTAFPIVPSAVSLVLGSGLVGTVVVGMMVGHWYLIRRDLPIRVLVRMSTAYLVLTLLRLAWTTVWVLGTWPRWSAAMQPFSLVTVLILQRWAFGLALPPVFAWMILQTARLRSTQSATGILYAAVVVTLLGEILGLYLWLHRGLLH